jgi:predicted nucleic acid-binding protein
VSDKQLVIDASVALKWLLRDEEAITQADQLQQDMLSGTLSLIAPTLFDYEIANALKAAVQKARISDKNAEIALAKFRLYAIERVDFLPYQINTLKLAMQHGRSVYDSAYMALAQTRNIWFFTGDRRLFNAVGQELSWVKWIGDYQFELVP